MHRRFLSFCDPTDIVARLGAFLMVLLLGIDLQFPCLWAEEPTKVSDPLAWQISADRIDYTIDNQEYVAEGNVSIFREGRWLHANQVRFNQKERLASAWGNVRLTSGKDILTGDSLELNLDDETGLLSRGSVFLDENHLYLSGDHIRKTGPRSYSAQSATLTTCDGAAPDWHITGKEVQVTIEGYGSAKHTAFWAGKIPLMYSPYLIFPVLSKRQSGLLTPEMSLSDRKGAQYSQPWFWAIDDSQDASFFAQMMSSRGVRLGAEYRYALSSTSMGALMLDGLQDRKIDDGSDSDTRWGYTGDGYARSNRDRYWVRAKANQDLPWEMTAKLDLDWVSDQDYLHEFDSGYSGFASTKRYFLDTFGRDVDDYDETIRLNQLNLNRTWHSFALNTDVRWYDNVIARRWLSTDTTLQNLPAISFNGVKQRLGSSLFYVRLDSDYTYFYRQDGTRGHRTDLYPRLHYPTRWANAINLEPSIGVRQTGWRIDHFDDAEILQRNDHYRTIYDLQLDSSTDFYRIYTSSLLGGDSFKHSLRPKIGYRYTPDVDQSDYPYFNSIDRIEARNQIVYSLTNTVTTRSVLPSPDAQTPLKRYTPLLRVKLEETFDIDKSSQDDAQPFSNILAEVNITPAQRFSLAADLLWSPYDHRFYGYNGILNVHNQRNDRLMVSYRYTRATDDVIGVRSVNLQGALRLGDHLRLRGIYEHNLDKDRLLEAGIGISYVAQCWSVDLDYGVEEEDRTFAVMVHLTGLGSLGN